MSKFLIGKVYELIERLESYIIECHDQGLIPDGDRDEMLDEIKQAKEKSDLIMSHLEE